jgi:hypothetical protein
MQIFWVRSESGEDFWGPYVERSLADRVRKIACMAGYEDAEVAVMDCDQDLDRISAGLLPWRIIAELESGKLMKTSCSLTWPPEDQEGIVRGEADGSGEEARQVAQVLVLNPGGRWDSAKVNARYTELQRQGLA